jgi:hypothetical protein
MKLILILAVLCFAAFAAATSTFGSNSFYGTYLLTNAEYGAGAVFGGRVWFNDQGAGSSFRAMRLDYLSASGAVFMTEIYNYYSKDKYQICGTNCAHATWNAPIPIFQATVTGTYVNDGVCPTPDYPNYQACITGCTGLTASPAQPQGVYQLGFNSSSTLCLVRFAVPTGSTFGPEWQILTYVTAPTWPNLSPLLNSTYYTPLNGISCPQPECFAKIDIALVIDQSGSIGSAWPLVVNFTESIVQSLALGPNQAQVGLAFFSGLGNCCQNYTGAVINNPSACNIKGGDCTKCGGLWDLKYQGTSSNKTFILNCIATQVYQQGHTCISCALQVGLQILQFAPRPNTPQILLLFTDGYENRITGILSSYAAYVRPLITKIIAVGVNQYVYSQLLAITGNASYVYATSSFTQLNSLIQSFIAPLCDPLPNIASCNYCSSLCACGTTCICPESCNDNNLCTNDLPCNPNPCPVGTGGKCIYTTVVCNDNNTCTTDTCAPLTGCVYTPNARPVNVPANTFCTSYSCQNNVGWVPTDNGPSLCGSNTDMCNIGYCNTTTQSCMTLNASTIAYGLNVEYTDSAGVSHYVQGCKKPAGDLPCKVYTCNSLTGACTVNTAACACQVSTDCNDNNGCTVDYCNTTANVCTHTSVDCYNILSSGACITNAAFTLTNATGYNVYIGNNQTAWTTLVNGLPSPNTTIRTCDELACFAGQRSQYNCQSTGAYSSQCVRTTSNCVAGACQDNICRSLGTWSANQANTDCNAVVPVVCPSEGLCVNSFCNTTWSAGSPTNTRCLNVANGTCNDNNVCTADSCSNSTGCVNTAIPLPVTGYCSYYTCSPTGGNTKHDNSTNRCPPNNNMCLVSFCNDTNSDCVTFDKTTFNASSPVTYVDTNGNVHTIYGCAAPAGALSCIVYSCNATNGACIVNTTGCQCLNSSACNDNNGCTNDTCVAGSCVYTQTDCYAQLSNGGCTAASIAAGYAQTNATGYQYFVEGIRNVTISGPATLLTPQQRTCDQLACFNGQPSTYTCQSLSASSSQCVRSSTACVTGGCVDNICASSAASGATLPVGSCSVAIPQNCNLNYQCVSTACNTSYVTGDNFANRCIDTSNSSNCNDNNVCTTDSCNNSTGCVFTPIAPPSSNNTCFQYSCDPINGYKSIEVGSATCGEVTTNLCSFSYCDPVSKSCKSVNASTLAYQTSVTITDSLGASYTVEGCLKPASDNFSCRKYVCNPSTGTCSVDISTCVCLSNSNCYDGNGCTIDTCDPVNNVCDRTTIDCYSYYSNGGCLTNKVVSASTVTGLEVWHGNAPLSVTQVDAFGNPSPASVTRTCDNLGCYNGQPSTYTCLSQGEGFYTCNRTFATCSMNGCQDNRCQTLGTWSAGGQINSNCNNIYTPNCADNNACTNDFCNSTWVPSSPVSQRCFHTPINATQVCDDGNVCTNDYCDPASTSGDICAHYLYDSRHLVSLGICAAIPACNNLTCSLNTCIYTPITCANPSLCFAYVCNATTNNTCVTVTSSLYVVDACGVCAGNGLSCAVNKGATQVKSSIATAAGVGGGIGGLFACAAAIAAGKKSYDKYEELANECNGQVTVSGAHIGAETGGANTNIRKSAFEDN